MKTLILLTAVETPAVIVGRLPALAELSGTYYPGTLRTEDQPGTPYSLIFSRYAKAWNKDFYVCADKNDGSETPDAGFPQNLQGIDCLIVDLTSENPDFTGVDAMLRELLPNLKENGETCRLLILCAPVRSEISDADSTFEPASEESSELMDGQSEETVPDVPSGINLPFLLYDGEASDDFRDCAPTDPVDLDTLCRLLFLGITSNDLDSIYEEPADNGKPAEKRREKSLFADVFDWIEVFCVALVGVILLMTFIVRRSPVEGSSMYPTLIGHNAYAIASADPEHGVQKNYDDLLISNVFYTPKRQDIVIIQEPSQLTEPIVKRIIGIGGDKVKINFDTWEVFVNGERLDEPYVNKKDSVLGSQLLKTDDNNCWEGTVPEGCVFVLGDNRSVSKDSRTFGFIDERYIIGKVIFRISPLDRFGSVED